MRVPGREAAVKKMTRYTVPSLAGGLMIAGLAGLDTSPVDAAGGRFVPSVALGSFVEQRDDPVDPRVRLSRLDVTPGAVAVISGDDPPE